MSLNLKHHNVFHIKHSVFSLYGFLLINFVTLGLSYLAMDGGPSSDWYVNQARAPWTPPPWFFGVAWTTIMIAFAAYMAQLLKKNNCNRVNTFLYVGILCACILWNILFFTLHLPTTAVFALIILSLAVSVMAILNYKHMRLWSLCLLPFIAWGCIATSLNIYSIIYN